MNLSSTADAGSSGTPVPPSAGDGRSSGLVAALSLGTAPPGGYSVIQFQPLPAIRPGAAERAIEVDQTNRSVIVDEQVVVKWFTPPPPLPQPAPEFFAHLAAVGFTEIARPYAALTTRDGDPGTLVALVTAYLPDAADGWDWCVTEAVAGRTACAADLGRLAADLHLALATPSPAIPEPVRHGDPGDGWVRRATHALSEALELTRGEDGEWLAAIAGRLRELVEPLGRAGDTPRIRVHGDLHVGQTLRWRDGYAIIDFDGNPTVRGEDPYQPAARDVAQLRTSLEHVAEVAIRRRGADPGEAVAWAASARDTLLSAYRTRLAEGGKPWLLEESLLAPFEIEQECRELIYATRHLPRWRYAPMGVLRARFPS
ncbi:hypothetical protein GCM10009677_62570 [Sphaerisporangium rubeum]|uniref:Glucosamine kinase n=1 Tax=Sphaerisporangium rubeum TaxID=321317 RepID=A0A7X0IC84_9ACTN|nr:aminoglycoside phosphotransferase [Sphaerisporangium rubeum]MBB6472358.1 maltokinase [Sphaerisporangium rubeum]